LADIEAYRNIIDNSHSLFIVLSSIDNLKVFSAARDNLKISKPLLERLGISKRKCHKALEQLKDAGLIEKDKEEGYSYTHTKFGSIVYQRNILEMGQYAKYSDKMQVINTIKHAQKFSEGIVAMFNEEIISSIVDSGGTSHSVLSSSSSISNHEDIGDSDISIVNINAIPKARIVLSYDNIVQLLRERIEYCKSEILIATRTSPEIIINKILQKSKLGVKVKVVADIDLVKRYFESQEEFTANNNNNNIDSSNNSDPKHKEKSSMINTNRHYHDQHEQESKNVISNPYYPNTAIDRRISDIPFGLVILDSNEVGIELVNSSNTKEFFAGVWIKDKEFAMAMKSFYETLWKKASENIEL
jgi:biotin operon repressor